MRSETERGQNTYRTLGDGTLQTSAGSVVEPFGGLEGKQTHFSYKGITLSAQIRGGGGKDGSRKTKFRGYCRTLHTDCILHSKHFQEKLKNSYKLKNLKWEMVEGMLGMCLMHDYHLQNHMFVPVLCLFALPLVPLPAPSQD